MKSREVASKKKVYRPEYENFKPLMLPKVTEISGNILPSPSKTNKADESCLYETVPVGGLHQMSNSGQKSADKDDMQNKEQQINRRQDLTSPGQPHLYNKGVVVEVTERIEDGSKIKRRPETSTKPLTKPPHPKQDADAEALLLGPYGLQNEHRIPSKTVAGTPALVKQHLSICRQPDIDRNNRDIESASKVYENMMKGGKIVMATENNTYPQAAAFKGNDKPQCGAMQRKEITYYQSSGGNKESVHDDNNLMYENIPLQMPTNFEKGMTKSHTFPTMTAGTDDHDLHDPMVPSPLSPLGRDGTIFGFSTIRQNEVKQYSEKTVTQKAGKIQLVLPATKKPPVSAKPLIVSLETKLRVQDDYKMTHKAKKDLPCDAVKEQEFDKDSPVSTILIDSDAKIPSEKRTKASNKSSPIQSTQFTSSVSYDRHLQDKPSQLQHQGHSFKAKQINVKQMKVNELGVWMTEKLRLGKYVSHFAEEMIDGALLVDMEEDMLITSFGFSVLEAKRLMKFATEGHVPT